MSRSRPRDVTSCPGHVPGHVAACARGLMAGAGVGASTGAPDDKIEIKSKSPPPESKSGLRRAAPLSGQAASALDEGEALRTVTGAQ